MKSTLSNTTTTSNITWNASEIDIWNDKTSTNDKLSDYGKWEGSDFVFTKDGGYPSSITIQYQQRGNLKSGDSAINTATLKTPDGKEISDDDTVKIANALNISKSGKADYQIAGETPNKQIQWTVNIWNQSADSMNDTVVTDDAFTSAIEDSLEIYDNGGTRLTEGYVLDATTHTITFKNTENYTIPSNLKIVYKTSVANVGDTQTNTANVKSIVTDNPPDPAETPKDNPPSVTYKNETALVKRGDGYIADDGKLKWKISIFSALDHTTTDGNGKVYYYGDDANTQTVDGYTITDDAFADLSADDFTFNACYLRSWGAEDNASVNDKSVIGITKDPNDPKTIIITLKDKDKKINKLELFYRTDVTKADTYTEEGFKNSSETNQLTAANNATTKSPNGFEGKGTGTQDYYDRYSVNKTCTSGEQNITTFDDKDSKTLSWKAELKKDSGFTKDNVVMTDTLSTTDGGKHYITPDEAKNIKLYKGGTTDELDTDMYTITFYATETDAATGTNGMSYATFTAQTGDSVKNAVVFKVNFTDKIDSANIHAIDVVYNTVAETSSVNYGQSTEYQNQVDFGDKHDSKTGMTFTRENPENPEKINLSLNVQKTWTDNKNADRKRPSKTQFIIKRALTDKDGNAPANNATAWLYLQNDGTYSNAENAKDTAKVFSVNVNNDDAQNLSLGTFPKWNVIKEGNTIKSIEYYCYQIEEINVSENYTAEYQQKDGVIKTEINKNSDTFVVTNKPNFKTYKKKAVNENGDEITSVNTSDLPKVTFTINGERKKYYLVGWEVSLGEYQNIDYIDTLPEGVIFLNADDANGNQRQNTEYANGVVYIGTSDATLANYRPCGEYSWGNYERPLNYYRCQPEVNGNEVAFHMIKDIVAIRYFTAVPADDIESVLDSEGNLVNKFRKSTEEQKDALEASVKINDNSEKNYLEKSAVSEAAGMVNYTLNVNETATKLSNGGKLIITDLLSIAKQENIASPLSFRLTSLTVYQVDTQGKKTKLSPEQYSYIDSYNVKESDSVTYPAKIVMTVPDKMHLQIEYLYQVTGYKGASNDKSDIVLDNKASFQSQNGSGSDQANGTQLYVTEAQAHNSVDTYPKIYKTDVNNYALNTLNATFKVAKWDGQKWVYASNITTETVLEKDSETGEFVENAISAHRVFTFSSALTETDGKFPTQGTANLIFSNTASETETQTVLSESDTQKRVAISPERTNLHNFALETGQIYKFIETVAPPDYQVIPNDNLLSTHEFVTFYYAYGDADTSTLPASIKKQVETVMKDDTINIPNSKNISISAKKTFSGSNPPKSAEVVLELLSSEFNSFDSAEPVAGAEQKTVNYPVNDTVTWTNLPSGVNGVPIYYFVREVSYKIGDNTYTRTPDGKYKNGNTSGEFVPVYSLNGTNTDGTVIEINNSNGIVVRKLWQDSSGKAITPPSGATIGFEVYGIDSNKVKHKLDLAVSQLPYNGSYEYVIPVEKTEGYIDFEVKEVLTNLTEEQKALLSDYKADTNKILENGAGILEIININQSIVYTTDALVQKVWADEETNHPDVTVKLIQTTQSLSSSQLANLNPADYGAIQNGQQAVVATVSGTSQYTVISEEEIKSVAVEPSSLASVTNSGKVLNVTANAAEGTGTITVTFNDDKTQQITLTVLNQTSTLTNSNLTKIWQKLPYLNADNKPYHYYVIETDSVSGYIASYTASVTSEGQKTTITNTSTNVSLKVKKEWADSGEHDAVTVKIYRSTNIADAPAVTTIAEETIAETTTTTVISSERESETSSETETISFDEKTLYNSEEYTHQINNTVSSITISFSEISTLGGIDFYIGDVWSKWFQMDNGALAAMHGSGSESYSISGNTITIDFGDEGRNVTSIKLRAKDMNSNDLWKISNITYVVAGSPSGETTAPSSPTEETETGATSVVTVDKSFAYGNDGQYGYYEVGFGSHVQILGNSNLVLNLSGEANKQCKLVAVGFKGFDTSSWDWYQSSEGVATLNDEGNGSLSISITENIRMSGIRINWYDSNDSTTLKINSYTITKGVSNHPRISIRPQTTTVTKATASSGNLRTKAVLRAGAFNRILNTMAEDSSISNISEAIEIMPEPEIILMSVTDNSTNGSEDTATDESSGQKGELVHTFTLSGGTDGNNWTDAYTVPMYDENNNPYYYWAVEDVPSGYKVSYQFSDNNPATLYSIDATKFGEGLITVKNAPEESESPELPETGGTGTRQYTALGLSLMALSVTIPYIRRKRRNGRKSA